MAKNNDEEIGCALTILAVAVFVGLYLIWFTLMGIDSSLDRIADRLDPPDTTEINIDIKETLNKIDSTLFGFKPLK